MPNIHPLLVHFPIALLTFSCGLDVLGMVTRRLHYERAAWWTLLGGFVGLGLTITTGILAETTVTIHETARAHFEAHEQLAFGVAAIYCILVLWRIAHRSYLPRNQHAWYLALSLVGVCLLWLTAWFGGELVFTFGVGVQR